MRYLFLITMLMGLAFAGIVESHDDVTWNHTHFWLSEAAYDDLDHDSIRWTGGHNHDGDGVKHGHPNDPEHGGNGTASKAHLIGSHGAVLKNAPAPPAKKNPAPPAGKSPAPAAGSGGETAEPEPVSVATSQSTTTGTRENDDVLRVSYVSFSDDVLTLQLTAYADNTRHNYLRIEIDGDRSFQTPALFFSRYNFTNGEMREITLTPHENERALILTCASYVDMVNGVPYTFAEQSHTYPYGADTVLDFYIKSFSITLQLLGQTEPLDTATQADFDSDSNRVGSMGAAPSLRRSKLTTLWATLKKEK